MFGKSKTRKVYKSKKLNNNDDNNNSNKIKKNNEKYKEIKKNERIQKLYDTL